VEQQRFRAERSNGRIRFDPALPPHLRWSKSVGARALAIGHDCDSHPFAGAHMGRYRQSATKRLVVGVRGDDQDGVAARGNERRYTPAIYQPRDCEPKGP
jgi:hypothetical protein